MTDITRIERCDHCGKAYIDWDDEPESLLPRMSWCHRCTVEFYPEFRTAERQALVRASGFETINEYRAAQIHAVELCKQGASVQDVMSATHLREIEAQWFVDIAQPSQRAQT